MPALLDFIIFDLDDTLYPRSDGLLQEVERRIEVWLRDRLGLTWEEAAALRIEYFQQHGTTLGGLIANQDVDAHAYLTFVHDVAVEEYLEPNPALAAMLDSISLRKAVFTNAPAQYSWRVLRALGVEEQFEQVIGIEEVGLRGKPFLDAYRQALARLDARGCECVMVEDAVRNLRPAKMLGMTTVLVGEEDHDDVDFVVGDVLQVGRVVSELVGR